MDFVLIDLVHMERAHLVTRKNMNANGFWKKVLTLFTLLLCLNWRRGLVG
jgi:hypothetical protein